MAVLPSCAFTAFLSRLSLGRGIKQVLVKNTRSAYLHYKASPSTCGEGAEVLSLDTAGGRGEAAPVFTGCHIRTVIPGINE